MTMLLGLLIAATPAATLIAADEVRLPSRDVRLADVAWVDRPGGLDTTVIARIPQNRDSVRLSRTTIADLIRRAVPGLTINRGGNGAMTLFAPARPDAPEGGGRIAISKYTPAKPVVEKGARLTLAARAGPVIIERPVTAAQPARSGDRRIFIRTDDGEIFAAPISAMEGRPNE